MFTTIKGYYENGVIVLKEPAPSLEKSEVLVTFTNSINHENQPSNTKNTVRGEYAKDSIVYIAPDFDDSVDDLFDVFK
jgi:hypothetical protein